MSQTPEYSANMLLTRCVREEKEFLVTMVQMMQHATFRAAAHQHRSGGGPEYGLLTLQGDIFILLPLTKVDLKGDVEQVWCLI